MYSFSPAGLQWPVRESRVLIPYTKAGNGVWSLLARDSYGAEWIGMSWSWNVSCAVVCSHAGLFLSTSCQDLMTCVRLKIRVKACSH